MTSPHVGAVLGKYEGHLLPPDRDLGSGVGVALKDCLGRLAFAGPLGGSVGAIRGGGFRVLRVRGAEGVAGQLVAGQLEACSGSSSWTIGIRWSSWRIGWRAALGSRFRTTSFLIVLVALWDG